RAGRRRRECCEGPCGASAGPGRHGARTDLQSGSRSSVDLLEGCAVRPSPFAEFPDLLVEVEVAAHVRTTGAQVVLEPLHDRAQRSGAVVVVQVLGLLEPAAQGLPRGLVAVLLLQR